MPINPSHRQILSSINNLKGKQGPKTVEGKIKSSLNGYKNKGIKSANKRAHVINSRWGLKKDSLYYLAGCLDCTQNCLWKSFSEKTPHDELPLLCFEKILFEKPFVCFYYFNGFCMSSCINKNSVSQRNEYCILDIGFIDGFKDLTNELISDIIKRELAIRKDLISKKKEAQKYLKKSKMIGLDNLKRTPRVIHIFRFIQDIIRRGQSCKFERWKSHRDLEIELDQIAYIKI